MAVRIRLKRTGRHKSPHYRVVAMDSRQKRDGRVLDNIGHYHPTEEFPNITINFDKLNSWIGNGAQMSETVRSLVAKLRRTPAKEE